MNYEGAKGGNYIRGKFFDLDLTGLDQAGALVDRADIQECDLISVDDETLLPPGFESIALVKSHETAGDGTPDVQGIVSFYPSLVENDSNWMTKFLRNFRQLAPSDQQILNLKHDIHSLYIKISDDLLARIQPRSNIDICAVKIEATNLEYFNGIKDDIDPSSEIGHPIETDSTEVVREVASLLGICFDALVEGRYKVAKNGRVRLSLNELIKSRELQHDEVRSPEPARSLGEAASKAVVLANQETPKQPAEIQSGPKIEPITFDSIGGNFATKQKLELLANQFLHPESAVLYDLTPTNFLLLGEPGTGKTSLAKAFATRVKARLIAVDSTDISSKWIGESAYNLKSILDKVTSATEPTVLFFDEIDALIGEQASGSNQTEAKRVLQVALTDLPKENPNLIFVAAANTDKDKLDRAFIRPGRFEVVEVTQPSQAECEDIWATIVTNSIRAIDAKSNRGEDRASENKLFDNIVNFNFKGLAELTDGWTGADITMVLKRAKIIAFNSFINTQTITPITQQLLQEVIRTFNR